MPSTRTRHTNKKIPLPEIDSDDLQSAGWQANVTQVDSDGKPIDWEADPEREVYFDTPGGPLAGKRLKVMKALMLDGRLVQLPVEPQINNQVAGDEADRLGLQRYIRRGAQLLTRKDNSPIVCMAWDCWAEAQAKFAGFCSAEHRQHTEPSNPEGRFGMNVTGRSSYMVG